MEMGAREGWITVGDTSEGLEKLRWFSEKLLGDSRDWLAESHVH